MMEFTLSRVTLCVCGAVLLGAVCVPISGIYSANEDVRMTENADSIADMIDSFWYSSADIMTLRGWDILPSPDCHIEVKGNLIFLHNYKKQYVSYLTYSSDFTLGYDEEINLIRTENGISKM